MRRIAFVFSVLALASPAAARAQHEVTADLGISIPRGAFDRNTDTGFGFVGSYVYSFGASRTVGLGGTASFLNYGSTQRRAPLSNTIPDITVDVDTNNNMGFVQGLLQIAGPLTTLRPYVQGSGGLVWFATTTSLKDPRDGSTVLSDTNQSDVTWVIGAGGGLQLRVWEAKPEGGLSAYGLRGTAAEARRREPTRAWIDFGLRYLKGGDVEYLKEGSLVTDEGEFDVDPQLARSEIELLQAQIGVAVTF